MRPDSLPRLWRYINLLLTYLLTYEGTKNQPGLLLCCVYIRHCPPSAWSSTVIDMFSDVLISFAC